MVVIKKKRYSNKLKETPSLKTHPFKENAQAETSWQPASP
jgi:hypothetical protein